MESTRNFAAWTQVAQIELTYKPVMPHNQRPQIRSSREAYELLLAVWNPELIHLQEEIKVMLLNNANRVLGIHSHSKGAMNEALFDRRLVLTVALKAGATGIFLAHNHPSGNLVPSSADNIITRQLTEAARLLNISVVDHLIVTTEGYYSFADNGDL